MIYLDNAATSFPKPSEVYEKSILFMRESGGNPGRGGHHYSVVSGQMVEETRRQVARFFGVPDPRRVIFTYNCTDSLNIVLKGLLRSGDHVLSTNLDHNALARPLYHLEQERGIQVERVPFSETRQVDSRRFRERIRANTALLVLTHGSNVLGCVQRLQDFLEIARESKIPLLLDASQTAGHIAIELDDAPVFLACSGHKGLYGMPGVGILTIPANVELQRWREGGSGSFSENLQHPSELPMRLEAGTPNFFGIASLRFGLDFIQRETPHRIHAKEMQLALDLYEFLRADSRFCVYSSLDETQLPVVSFNIEHAPPEEIGLILDQEFGIAVRPGLHCAAVVHEQLGTTEGGCIRVSPGYFNRQEDIGALKNALDRIAAIYGKDAES